MARTKQDHRKVGVMVKPDETPQGPSPDDIKRTLRDLLDKCEGGGTFATSGVYTEAPLPGLEMSPYGPIPLPLMERDALEIIDEHEEDGHGRLAYAKAIMQRLIYC